MSSFMKKGKRASQRKEGKARMEEVVSILADLDLVAHELINSGVDITEENLKSEAEKYTDRALGNLEEALLMSKLKDFQEKLEAKRVEAHD